MLGGNVELAPHRFETASELTQFPKVLLEASCVIRKTDDAGSLHAGRHRWNTGGARRIPERREDEQGNWCGSSCGLGLKEPINPNCFGRNGGDDGARTRGLCRDSSTGL